MNKKIVQLTIIAAALLTGISACKKNKIRLLDIQEIASDKAFVKIGYFTPWIRNNSVQVKVNGQRVSNLLTYSVAYPGGGFNMGGLSNADYLALDSGKLDIKISIPQRNTETDSIDLFNGSITLPGGNRYTVFFTDSTPNITATVVPDPLSDPPVTFARMKFFNGIPNVGSLDLYVRTSQGIVQVKDIAYRSTSAIFDVSAASTDTFDIVRAGLPYTTANTLARYLFTSPQNGRVYTVLARGFNIVSTTDIRRPQVSLIVNR
jgi:Domain of unknown function (DUF4397)